MKRNVSHYFPCYFREQIFTQILIVSHAYFIAAGKLWGYFTTLSVARLYRVEW
jgi:hypothetical protein